MNCAGKQRAFSLHLNGGHMKRHFPLPTGELQGDTRAMPDRGTGTGMSGHNPMLDGHSTDADATNAMGGMGGAARSDDADCNMPKRGAR